MKSNNLKYIVVHSTKSVPGSIPFNCEFNYIISATGELIKKKRPLPGDGCLSIAYTGGLNSSGKPDNTLNERQAEQLFELLVKLSTQHRAASILGANQLYNDPQETGFDLGEWLRSYTPKILQDSTSTLKAA